jgi:hypothetical protein
VERTVLFATIIDMDKTQLLESFSFQVNHPIHLIRNELESRPLLYRG